MKPVKHLHLSTLGAAVSCLIGSSALAGSATSNMNVSANVSNSCSISASPLTLGAYDPSSTGDATGSSSISITCTKDAPVSIMLGEGSNADTGSTQDAPLRRMSNGTDFLSYALFQDAGFTTGWGDTAVSGKSSTGLGSPETHSVYLKIAAAQNVSAGAYSDTVVATVSF